MNTMTPDQFRRVFPAFAESPDEFISDILSVARRHHFPEKAEIYCDGDVCRAIAFLISGEIRVYKTGSGGREITLYEVCSGETCILNASCILSGINYPAHATATVGGEMLLIPAADFRKLIARHEFLRDFVFSVLSRRLAEVMALIEEVAFGRMDQRLLEYLRSRSNHNVLFVTHQKIADDLGTSREVVSRLLKDFEKRGIVSLSRQHVKVENLPLPHRL